MSKEIRIGTSGFYYGHWYQVFYPEDIPKSEWLEYYQKYFDTVELNSTFYHLPKEKTVKEWNERTKKDFLFSVKASRYITHIKYLKDPEQSLERFFEVMGPIRKKTGPVLFQLSGAFKKNLDRLAAFLKELKKYPGQKVFEFRNASWWDKEVFDVLRKRNACFCWFNMPGQETPDEVTSDFIYIRMHGGSQLYGSRYTDGELEKLAEKIYKVGIKRVFVYFNNDAEGYAVENALKLKEVLNVK